MSQKKKRAEHIRDYLLPEKGVREDVLQQNVRAFFGNEASIHKVKFEEELYYQIQGGGKVSAAIIADLRKLSRDEDANDARKKQSYSQPVASAPRPIKPRAESLTEGYAGSQRASQYSRPNVGDPMSYGGQTPSTQSILSPYGRSFVADDSSGFGSPHASNIGQIPAQASGRQNPSQYAIFPRDVGMGGVTPTQKFPPERSSSLYPPNPNTAPYSPVTSDRYQSLDASRNIASAPDQLSSSVKAARYRPEVTGTTNQATGVGFDRYGRQRERTLDPRQAAAESATQGVTFTVEDFQDYEKFKEFLKFRRTYTLPELSQQPAPRGANFTRRGGGDDDDDDETIGHRVLSRGRNGRDDDDDTIGQQRQQIDYGKHGGLSQRLTIERDRGGARPSPSNRGPSTAAGVGSDPDRAGGERAPEARKRYHRRTGQGEEQGAVTQVASRNRPRNKIEDDRDAGLPPENRLSK